jgi:hypothetical protein
LAEGWLGFPQRRRWVRQATKSISWKPAISWAAARRHGLLFRLMDRLAKKKPR